MDEKPHRYESLPIPTYDEAVSSRPTSSQSRIGPEEISDDAERQGLLGHSGGADAAPRRSNYEPPSVQDGRLSLDSLDGIEVESDEGEVRREMEQMDMEDPDSDNGSHRSLLTYRFKRFTSFTSSLSSLRLPSFRRYVPSIRWPTIDWEQMNANRIVIIGRLFGIAIIMGVLYALFATNVLSITRARLNAGQSYDPEIVRQFVQNRWRDPNHIGHHLKRITQYPHVAGSEGSYVLGEYVAEIFKEAHLESIDMERFDVYLNYPRKDGRKVSIVTPEDQQWEAQVEEDNEDSLVFHGHSKSGDVTGPLIYANFGSRDDFERLKSQGVSVQGAVVLVRYYGTEGDRALKVKAAAEAGAAGCIIYSDPSQDGFLQGSVYPEGRFMPPDGVQRGSVALTGWVVGDVLSPGWASTPSEKRRLQPEESEGLNKIPSIPLSWRDAHHLLGALKGHGTRLDGDWVGDPDTEYWTGSQDSPKVNLKNEQDEEVYQPIYNVIGKITGWEQPDKKVIVGNHRDAWCLGAADPGSGTAIMLHMIHTFGELLAQDWRPLRTIEFVSWDAEEYNLVGSTEHVENRADELRRNGVAYLNVDVGATGSDLDIAGSPIFNSVLRRAMGRVSDPHSNGTLRDLWEAKNEQILPLGAGSDYVAFQDIVGTSSLDLSFIGEPYPYHSCHDNYDWMERFGDPNWEFSAALGQVWALLTLDLADNPLLPLDIDSYATSLSSHVDALEADIRKLSSSNGAANSDFDFTALRDAIKHTKDQARKLVEFDDNWITTVYAGNGFESNSMTVKRVDRNNRVANFESHLLDLTEGGGLVNRTQYKHVIFAPQAWSGYDGETFPSIRQWMYSGEWHKVQDEINKVTEILQDAARGLDL